MHNLKIYTNNKPRPIIYGFELTDKQKSDFDYLDDINNNQFFKYKGQIYDISQFMRVCDMYNDVKFTGYHGHISDSYFSGILIKLCEDTDYIIVACYYSIIGV